MIHFDLNKYKVEADISDKGFYDTPLKYFNWFDNKPYGGKEESSLLVCYGTERGETTTGKNSVLIDVTLPPEFMGEFDSREDGMENIIDLFHDYCLFKTSPNCNLEFYKESNLESEKEMKKLNMRPPDKIYWVHNLRGRQSFAFEYENKLIFT